MPINVFSFLICVADSNYYEFKMNGLETFCEQNVYIMLKFVFFYDKMDNALL